MMKQREMNMFDQADANPFISTFFFGYMMPKMMEPALRNAEVQKLLHSDEKFDVVIVEQFMNNAEKALATHFGAPLVGVSALGANFWLNTLVGNSAPPSYIPMVVTDYSAPMTFCERLLNSLLFVVTDVYFNLVVYPAENEIIKKTSPTGLIFLTFYTTLQSCW